MTEMNTATATMTENSNGGQAVKYDLVEQLSRKMSISLEDATAALEAANWNMLTATYLLEQEELRRMQAVSETAESCVINDNTTQNSVSSENATNPKKCSSSQKVAGPKRQCHWFSNLRDHMRRLLTIGNHNRFTIVKDGDQILEMPVTALALLLLFSFGTCALLMVVGLFAGCRYSITTAIEA